MSGSDIVDIVKLVYDAAGVTGLLIVCLLAVLLAGTWALYLAAKRSAEEAKISRNETKVIQAQLQLHLQALLDDCNSKCDAYELQINEKQRTIEELKEKVTILEKNENWLRCEITNLSARLREVEKR